MNEAVKNLKITNRMLSQEAERRGWKVEVFYSTLYAPQAILRAEKDGREFFYSSTLTSLTPVCGFLSAEDKYLTYGLLNSAGIPVPSFVMIPSASDDFSEAEALLQQYGRVIVKPTCTNHGDGITLNITDRAQLLKAIDIARKAAVNSSSSAILVQRQIEGKEYRFLVVNGKCIAVANRRPAFVVGDGTKTIRMLIAAKNQDPLRGDEHDKPLTKISLDEVAAVNGTAFLDFVPQPDQEVEVLKTSNLSRGGEAANCTSIASPKLKALAVAAATRCQLGIAGVDIMTTDIHSGEHGYVIEVNSSPGLRMHAYPSIGKPTGAVERIIDVLERHATKVSYPPRQIIGRSEYLESPLFGDGVKVPARIDTGARVASIWASHISMDENGRLHFCLFDEQSEFYTGEVHEATDYKIATVRNSTGQEEMRFRVKFPIVLAGKKINASFTLSDRSSNSYPILIGRNIINNKFIVDVSQMKCQHDDEVSRVAIEEANNQALKDHPYKFYRQHADQIAGVKATSN